MYSHAIRRCTVHLKVKYKVWLHAKREQLNVYCAIKIYKICHLGIIKHLTFIYPFTRVEERSQPLCACSIRGDGFPYLGKLNGTKYRFKCYSRHTEINSGDKYITSSRERAFMHNDSGVKCTWCHQQSCGRSRCSAVNLKSRDVVSVVVSFMLIYTSGCISLNSITPDSSCAG